MKKKNVIKALAITAGVAAIGYIAKKVHDINEDLKQLSFDDLNDDLFECDEEKTENEKNIFVAQPITQDEPTEVEIVKTEEESVEEAEEIATKEDFEESEFVEAETEEEIPLPPEVINKVGKLEDLLTFEGLDFDTNQRDYLYHIIDYMKKNHEMRMALLIAMDYKGRNPLEVFTDNQFAEIKKIIG